MGSTDLTNLINAHDSMTTFPDLNKRLRQIAAVPNMVVVFTNNNHSMVSNAILRSKNLAIHAGSIRDIISIDKIGQFKPPPAVYHYLADRIGKSNALKDILLVSGNAFDVTGALSVGMNAVFVDRENCGWKDRAVPELELKAVVSNLGQVADFVSSH